MIAPADVAPSTRVLVTGASGLIGRQVRALLRDRVELVCVSRFERDSDDDGAWRTADLTVPGTAKRLVEQIEPSVVLHLAGAVRGDRSLKAVLPTLSANLVATVELLEASTRAGVSRVVVSGSALEEPAGGAPFAVPPSPYGASRWASSMYARLFHTLFETPVAILRPSYTYGPGQKVRFLIPMVITDALRGVSTELASGDRRMDFVYSEDVGRAYVAAMNAPGLDGEVIDLGCGRRTAVRDVVELLRGLVGRDAPEALYGAIEERPFEQDVEVDTTAAQRLLGWSATTALQDGLARTIEWYVAHSECH